MSQKAELYFLMGDNATALKCYEEAYRLHCEHETEWSVDSVLVNVHRCCMVQTIEGSDRVLPTIEMVRDYMTNVISVKEHLLMGWVYYFMARMSFDAGKF